MVAVKYKSVYISYSKKLEHGKKSYHHTAHTLTPANAEPKPANCIAVQARVGDHQQQHHNTDTLCPARVNQDVTS
jgi:hypothetical protein